MNIYSNLRVRKTNAMDDDKLDSIWNNLIRAMSIVNGAEIPDTPIYANNHFTLRRYTTPDLGLGFSNSLVDVSIQFCCDSSLVNDLGGALEIVAATTSALEYVVDREDCLGIEEWRFTFGNLDDKYQDVGVASIADVMGVSKERAIDLLEKHVEPKLDEIEKNCL